MVCRLDQVRSDVASKQNILYRSNKAFQAKQQTMHDNNKLKRSYRFNFAIFISSLPVPAEVHQLPTSHLFMKSNEWKADSTKAAPFPVINGRPLLLRLSPSQLLMEDPFH